MPATLIKVYSSPQVDRIWLWVSYNTIPIYPDSIYLRGTMNPGEAERKTMRGNRPAQTPSRNLADLGGLLHKGGENPWEFRVGGLGLLGSRVSGFRA